MLWLVTPGAGSVVDVSPPSALASTNRKSHSGSVAARAQNDSCPPPAGTLMVRASRLNDGLDTCESPEYATCVPLRGLNGLT